jgi:UMF1 family MFS transporter
METNPADTAFPIPPSPALPDAPKRFSAFSLPVLSWAFYDFANTIFSFAVITRYFNEWVIEQHDRPDWHVGLMSAIVGLVLIVTMPAIGAISDQLGRRLPFLAAFTLACVAATGALGAVVAISVAHVFAGLPI